MPQTPIDLVEAFRRRWGNELAERPGMPSMSGGPWPGSGPSSPPNPEAGSRTSSQEEK